MRAVVQRVSRAEVRVVDLVLGSIGKGLLVYTGVQRGDTAEDANYIASKVSGLRVFEDTEGKMNLDVKQTGGSVLVISQFTLAGDSRKGRRPSFEAAEAPQKAKELYLLTIDAIRAGGIRVEEGEFQAHMEVDSINDGPVTILLDSKRLF